MQLNAAHQHLSSKAKRVEETGDKNKGKYGNVKEGNLEGPVLRCNHASTCRVSDTPYPWAKKPANAVDNSIGSRNDGSRLYVELLLGNECTANC